MQASDRARELERVYQSRRGHAPQISITDDNHHVTEAIGDMYGADDEPSHSHAPPSPEYNRRAANRPLSFIAGPAGECIDASIDYLGKKWSAPLMPSRLGNGERETERVPPVQISNGDGSINGVTRNASKRMPRDIDGLTSPTFSAASGSPVNPPILNGQPSDTANQRFEMSLDYSKPEDVAQELSNLQAIRRMSMDVTQDPDLPSFSQGFRMPPLDLPTHGADEGDPSRLFWVPARLHPELAPKEFKTFIEDKVKTIKRSSQSEEEMRNPDGMRRQSSGGVSLRRKKSMLSRQINSGSGYEDGAVRLGRQKSLGGAIGSESPTVELKDLETVLRDPTSLARSMSLDAQRESLDSGVDLTSGDGDDAPTLPMKPAGASLKRSTRTQYRRGSVRKGEKLPFSKRIAVRQGESDAEFSPPTSPNSIPEVPQLPPSRVQAEAAPQTSIENFSRPGRRQRTPPSTSHGPYSEAQVAEETPTFIAKHNAPIAIDKFYQQGFSVQGRTSYAPRGSVPVPEIVETPPPPSTEPSWKQRDPSVPRQHPQRSSSRGQTPSPEPPQQPSSEPQPPQPNQPRQVQGGPGPNIPRLAPVKGQQKPGQVQNRTFRDAGQNASPMLGNQTTRTDAQGLLPTLEVEETGKKRKGKDESRKGSWSWFLGSEEKEKKEKEKRRDDDEPAVLKKQPKNKISKTTEASDSGRLDVLQASIDGGGRSRESQVMDRSSLRLDEERKKESVRKSSDGSSGKEGKKDKEPGIFSSIFGGSKKKDSKDNLNLFGTGGGGKKGSSQRGLSPEPPPRVLKADIDYNWTRFSIMEERAIYRMAHIKLANPRRELYSQVLLSNFMYSYLAKVQSQHPGLQVPGKRGRGGNAQVSEGGGGSGAGAGAGVGGSQGGGQDGGKDGGKMEQQPEEFAAYQRYHEQQARRESQASDGEQREQREQREQQQQQQQQQSYQQQHNQRHHEQQHEQRQEEQQYAEEQEQEEEIWPHRDDRLDSRGNQHEVYDSRQQQQQLQHQHHHQGYGSNGYGGQQQQQQQHHHQQQQQQYHHNHHHHHQQQQQQFGGREAGAVQGSFGGGW